MGIDKYANLYRTRLSDLPLEGSRSLLSKFKKKLKEELAAKGIFFKFSLYISDEWFCPDRTVTVALPFYVFNPDLLAIEKEEMGVIEGKDFDEQLKYLRHELGHCIDNAFALRRFDKRQQLFGSSKKPYPRYYRPQKYSRSYIDYLGGNYGQCHPDEDFAETFAAWLDPENIAHKKCRSITAYDKLNYMHDLMSDVSEMSQRVIDQRGIDPINKYRITLADHYRKLKITKHMKPVGYIERRIKSCFHGDESLENGYPVSHYLRREKKTLSRVIAEKTGAYSYQVQWAVDSAIAHAERCNAYGTKAQLRQKSPLLIEGTYRYLVRNNQLKFYL